MQLMVLGKHTNELPKAVLYFLKTNTLWLTTLVWCLFSLAALCLISLTRRWQHDQEQLLPVPPVLRSNPPSTERMSLPFTSLVRGVDSQRFSYVQLKVSLGVCQDMRRRGLHKSLKVCKFIMQALREASGVDKLRLIVWIFCMLRLLRTKNPKCWREMIEMISQMISFQERGKLDLQRIALYSEDLNTFEPHISTLDITRSQVLKVSSLSSLLEVEMIKFWTFKFGNCLAPS